MKYDFTSIMDRRGLDAMAVDMLGTGQKGAPDLPRDGFDAIPMWVADMNFPTAPTIIRSIAGRLEHPAFGYFMPRDEYYASIIHWHETRNGVRGMTKDCIGYENGVLGGVVSALNVFCSKGDNVLLHSPTYVGFTSSLNKNGYHSILSPLRLDENNVWRMDYEDMERRIVANNVHAAVFCSPHNPCGRVWEREEIEQAMEIFRRHDVYVVSDEIWSDLILTGHKHIPTQSVSDDARNRTVALYAPSKTFNLAGLVGSYHVIYNSWIRDRINKESALSSYNHQNVLSMYALIGAYQPEGAEWVDELCEVLTQNTNYACDYIGAHLDGVKVSRPEGTYMLFLDCGEWCEQHGKMIDEVIKAGWDVGVAWQDGRGFYGATHIRMNLAVPYTRVVEACDRLNKYVFNEGGLA